MSAFIKAQSLEQALDVMSTNGVQVLAGGTDLMLSFRQSRLNGLELPSVILDVSCLPELNRLELGGKQPYIGAGVTFHRLTTDPIVSDRLLVLAQAAATVGSVQIRNTATIGGNVANASPAADGVSALIALGARAEIVSTKGARYSSLSELIIGPNKTNLKPDELILGFELDHLPGEWGQSFVKAGRRQAVNVARINLAVCLDEKLADPRVVLGSCFPNPRRLTEVEEIITNGNPSSKLWQQAGSLVAANFTDVCGWRSSAPYKVPTIGRMSIRALSLSWDMLRGAS